jgi:hypothetical protein
VKSCGRPGSTSPGGDRLHEPLPERTPGVGPLDGAALTHGFQIAFYVLAALAALAAVISAIMIESGAAATTSSEGTTGGLTPVLEEAA